MYGFNVRLSTRFDEAIARVTLALKDNGFGVLSDIDVQATLQAKLGVERKPYRILGACNPHFARQAIDLDPEVGLLLPCNVVVREEDDGTILVSFMDPVTVLGLIDHAGVTPLATEVRSLLEQVRDSLVD
ncbi:hypothetical protein CKO25_06610 [Thiocapsa imhoffii]|uniref:DUF302 domain-containing protein n=1 Tax=Thiocapsa imhoffii TaxID=382777 RepID=A0A9X1B8U1_9GAMM|nr:DUF302 domain-containing protein [Thiocapsa imhoffii]MBK1644331.1 hypothetical protein [Thiocapsa imhoffii]